MATPVRRARVLLVALLLLLSAAGVALVLRAVRPPPPAPVPPALIAGPVDVRLPQRSTRAVGDDGRVFFHRSLRPGEAARFRHGGHSYLLRCTGIDNHPVGEDSTAFRLEPDAGAPSEDEKIDRLIAAIRTRPDLVFIRNGSEHAAAAAADHLAMKRCRAGDRIASAEDFIEHLASRSSMSGEPYRIRFPDGREVESGAFLREELERIHAHQDAGVAP